MTHQDFVDAILAEPSDDAPRLIYADWLEERGDPRAEFIRVQVEMATLVRPPLGRNSMYGNPMPQPRYRSDSARLRELWGRQLELLCKHCAEWVEPLIGKATGVIFERGCVEGISTPAKTFVTHASTWYRSIPIRQLCISALSSPNNQEWRSLLRSPHLLKIQTLELGWRYTPGHLADLAGCQNVVNLTELFLGHNRFNGELIHKLRQSPNLKKLRTDLERYEQT